MHLHQTRAQGVCCPTHSVPEKEMNSFPLMQHQRESDASQRVLPYIQNQFCQPSSLTPCQWGLWAWSSRPWPGKSARGQPWRTSYSGRILRGLSSFGSCWSNWEFSAKQKVSAPSPNSFICPSWTTTPRSNASPVKACLCYFVLRYYWYWIAEEGGILPDA